MKREQVVGGQAGEPDGGGARRAALRGQLLQLSNIHVSSHCTTAVLGRLGGVLLSLPSPPSPPRLCDEAKLMQPLRAQGVAY